MSWVRNSLKAALFRVILDLIEVFTFFVTCKLVCCVHMDVLRDFFNPLSTAGRDKGAGQDSDRHLP